MTTSQPSRDAQLVDEKSSDPGKVTYLGTLKRARSKRKAVFCDNIFLLNFP